MDVKQGMAGVGSDGVGGVKVVAQMLDAMIGTARNFLRGKNSIHDHKHLKGVTHSQTLTVLFFDALHILEAMFGHTTALKDHSSLLLRHLLGDFPWTSFFMEA